MQVQLATRRGVPVCKTVASWREASEAVRKFIGHRGASQCPRGMGLITEGGKIAAHVSFSGRVWSGRPDEHWKSDVTLLYDPRKSY